VGGKQTPSYPPYTKNPFIVALFDNNLFSMVLVFSLFPTVLYVTRVVVHEKDKRLKVRMHVSGQNAGCVRACRSI
jgi:hypothetical protein